jgi:hypothetical protein
VDRDDELTPLEKMQITLDLFEASVEIQRQNLRRSHPRATEAEIEDLLAAWLEHRPGAEHGDGEGRPASRFPQDP